MKFKVGDVLEGLRFVKGFTKNGRYLIGYMNLNGDKASPSLDNVLDRNFVEEWELDFNILKFNQWNDEIKDICSSK